MLREFRRYFWQPPRAHGDVIEDRTVSFLELFFDLVFVVLIGGAARTLAHDITWRSTGEFVLIFALIWFAWVNSTSLYDLHGREDVRTRSYVFAQMLLLALLAVFVGEAAGDGGRAFASVLAAFMLLLTWLWYSVRRQDSEEFEEITRSYLWMMGSTTVWILGSAFAPAGLRLAMWTLFVVAWSVVVIVLGRSEASAQEDSLLVSDSLVERFGLFTIIVLGEVIVGVVEGLSEAERDPKTIATGLVGLIIGFGFWWTYFDLVGRRLPFDDGRGFPRWLVAHLPLTASIAAAGAAMVTLIEHATDARAPAAATLLLTGSVSLGFASLIVIVWTLQDFEDLRAVFVPTSMAMLVGTAAVLLIGLWRPAPIVLVVSLAAVQGVVWGFGVSRWVHLQIALEADTAGSGPV